LRARTIAVLAEALWAEKDLNSRPIFRDSLASSSLFVLMNDPNHNVKTARTPVALKLAKENVDATEVGDVQTLDKTMGPDDALVHDALCVMQAPTGMTRLSEMMTAAGLKTAHNTNFNPAEVRKAMDRLLASGHMRRDVQSRSHATAPHGPARFRQLMRDPAQAAMWFEAWRKLTNFDRTYSLGYQEEEQLAAALRLVIYGGRALGHFQRLHELAYSFSHLWVAGLHQAVLQPFDATLFDQVEPALQTELAESLLTGSAGVVESATGPLEDWLLQRSLAAPPTLSAVLRLRLAEALLFRGDLSNARALCQGLGGASVELVLAVATIAEGSWEAGATQFELAYKKLATQSGRRKNLAPPAMLWPYLMALLSRPAPEAWSKARKFAASELGKREADPFDFWGVWQEAIDQRLGDAPKAHQKFCLVRHEGAYMQSLQYLHHLLLGAWLRVGVAVPASLRAHALALAGEFDAAKMHWLAQLARRAADSLLDEPAAPTDTDAPFFIGPAQDSWREALASILALGGDSPVAAQRKRTTDLQDRLIWVVNAGADGRIKSIEPMEQKAGVRGLGKPKPVALSSLIKRKELPAHDAAVLRTIEREEYGNRPVIDVVAAVQALVRHPCVAWERDPTQFIEIVEAMPALESMAVGDDITFRLLDPVRTPQHKLEEAKDEMLPQRWRQARQRLRNVMLLADSSTQARLVRLTPAQLRVAELVSQGWKVPVAAREELDEALRVLAAHFQVASDADAGHEVEPHALLRAELTPQGGNLMVRLLSVPFGDFGPRLPPGTGRERVTTVHQGVTLSTKRNLAQEMAALQGLLEVAHFLEDTTHDWLVEDPQQALAVVESLSQLKNTIVTEWPKGKPMRVRSVADGAVKLTAVTKGNWLELEGDLVLDAGEVVHLRRLLELAQGSRSRYVALGEGDFLALSDALRQQLIDLAALAQPNSQRISNVAALAWEASGNSLSLDGDAAWHQRSQAWEKAQTQVFNLPAGLVADLRDYQLEGYRWLMRLGQSGFGAVLADDMGLGKTVQTLAVLLQRSADGPTLVVAPTSVCGNWLAETARFTPGLQVELYGDVLSGVDNEEELANSTDSTDSAADTAEPANAQMQLKAGVEPSTAEKVRLATRRRQVRALGPGQVLVCSYALLQIDASILSATHWNTVVLDEAQAIKNPTTRRAKAALALQSNFRLALTGTPIENRLGELWSIMSYCNPGLLGSAEQFAQRFGNVIERSEDLQGKAQASRQLRRLISPFLLRRNKAEVLIDLPPRTEIVHEVVPGPKERALLEALRQQAEASVAQVVSANAQTGGGKEGQNQFHVLAALTRLRRAACDPRLVAPELGLVGAKVQEFERLAVELVAGRHKALVFSQFTDFLGLLRERLDLAGLSYQYLDGSTPAAERTKRVAAFQAGQGDLFLISLKAGGFGLNLTMADYVIIADPWWNPAAEEQASARAHRMGQQRPVTVYRLVTQGSIEEKIVRLHRSKRDLAEGILSGQDTTAPIDAGQLMDLLKGQ
jgi:superfamily II DNA or RNA helicase